MHIDHTYLHVYKPFEALGRRFSGLCGKVAGSNQRQGEANTISRSLTESLLGRKPKSYLRIWRTNCVSKYEEAAAGQPGPVATDH